MFKLLFTALLVSISVAKVVLVYQVARHGARSSPKVFSGVIETPDENFVRGNQTLTRLGLEQTYERGVLSVNKYNHLFENSHMSNIKVRSSNTTRTIFSTYAHLLGIYGSLECRKELRLFTQAHPTKEVNSFNDIGQSLTNCFTPFIKKVVVQKEGDSTFQMNNSGCDLYNNLT